MSALTIQLSIIALFFVLNISFNTYNKYLFTTGDNGAGFNVPLLCTISHAVAGFLVSYALTFFPSIFTRKRILHWRMWFSIFSVSVFFATATGLNNSSLQYLPLSTQQIIRCTAPAAVAMASVVFEGKSYSLNQVFSLLVLIGGAVLAVSGGDVTPAKSYGTLLCFLSVAASALQLTFVSINVGPSYRLGALDVLFYTSLPTIVLLFPAMIVNDEITKLRAYVSVHGADMAVCWFLLGQLLAVLYNITIFSFVKIISAIYVSVCGVFKVVLIILFSIVVFHEGLNAAEVMGVSIAVLGFAYNSYLEFQVHQLPLPNRSPEPPSIEAAEHSRLLGEETDSAADEDEFR